MNWKKVAPLNLPASPAKQELSVPQSHRAKVSHAAPRGGMQQDRVLGFRWNPHLASRAMLLEVHLVGGPEIYRTVLHQRLEFFLCAFCRSASAGASRGRGLRSRKPSCRNKRWHCRTPKSISYRSAIQAAKVLPSHRFPPNPISRGIWRRALLTSRSCFSFKRLGRPDRSPSRNPAKPFRSKPRTQYSTDRGASPRSLATSGQLMPWATKSTPCRRWSYRDSSERRISSCSPRIIVAESAMVRARMPPSEHAAQ